MAGYSRLYCIGDPAGYLGSDGLNPIRLQIWVGDADRQWWEAHHCDRSIRPMGQLNVIVPKSPDHPHALIDSCLAFFPDYFAQCASLISVRAELGNQTQLDFNAHPEQIPSQWNELRTEAATLFSQLHIFAANLTELDLENGSFGRRQWL